MTMIRQYGSPTLLLTFSCAEYNSPQIEHYLCKMNDVSSKYLGSVSNIFLSSLCFFALLFRLWGMSVATNWTVSDFSDK